LPSLLPPPTAVGFTVAPQSSQPAEHIAGDPACQQAGCLNLHLLAHPVPAAPATAPTAHNRDSASTQLQPSVPQQKQHHSPSAA
jgi:hypothetical protein